MKRFLVGFTIVLILFSAIFGFVIAVATKLALFEVFMSLTPTEPLLTSTNILVLGIDNAFGHRSDTIMVLHTDPENKEASLISIPRDTLAVLPDRGLDKINHAYAYGGIDLSRRTVEKLLGLQIPYYISVNLSGIIEIIDELGGVNINVEKRMYYVDYAGGLYVDLKPGQQKLSGKQAMGYLRYRRDGGDFKRIGRQQQFLRSFGDELLKRDNLLRSPKLFLTLLSFLDTNLNSRETLGLALSLRQAYELGQVNMSTLPGADMMVDGIYYWKLDQGKLNNIVKRYFNGGRAISWIK
ncbi:MAG: LCP family protein [Candidatus Margulisbacteria bacterium]|nr:LCP family protein [Candidatus Margulisiibacteriota bacterium]